MAGGCEGWACRSWASLRLLRMGREGCFRKFNSEGRVEENKLEGVRTI